MKLLGPQLTTVLLLTPLLSSNAAVLSASSLGLEAFPDGLPDGFDYDFTGLSGTQGVPNNGIQGTVLCAKPSSASPLYDWISSITLTTDAAPNNRLVGISFTCSRGSSGFAYSGGRSAPLSGDKTTTAKGTYFGGGFNAAGIVSGLKGESLYVDGGNIVSGLTIASVQSCSSLTTSVASSVTSSVTGGSTNLFSPAISLNNDTACLTGDKFVGFSFSAGSYFNALQLYYYGF